jgi:hypothetical protein
MGNGIAVEGSIVKAVSGCIKKVRDVTTGRVLDQFLLQHKDTFVKNLHAVLKKNP